jgi:conjugal transfer ATP-binding protein TraC
MDWHTHWETFRDTCAHWLGEKETGEKEAAIPSDAVIRDFFEQYPLSSLLPYESYDEAHALFINKKSIGFMLEVSPLMGASVETENILASLFTDVIPSHADVQFLLWASPKIGRICDGFEAARRGSGASFEWLAKQRTDFLKKGALQSLARNGTFILRDFLPYVVVSIPKKHREAECQPEIDELVALRQDIQSSLKSVNIESRSIPINNFIRLLWDLLNPSSNVYPSDECWNELEPLHTQLTDPETHYAVYSNKVISESEEEHWDIRSFTVRKFPKRHAPGHMTEAIGQLFNTALQIPCPFVISLTVRPADHERSAGRAQLHYLNKDKTARSPLAKFKPTASAECQDWAQVRNRLSEGDRLVKVFYQVVTYALACDANTAERKVRDLYRANGWKLSKERYLQFPSWLSLFPMMMTEGFYQDKKILGRLRTLTAFNAITIAPLQGEWKGSRSANLLLPGRRGQLATWSPFDNQEGNYNVAIAAKSGSGKSVLTQEYIVSLVGSGGRVWIIDVGRSYEKTCRLLGGEFIAFLPEKTLCINPFTFISQFDESLELLKPLTAAMARPHGQATDEEMTWLEKALKAAWQQEKNQATLTTVATWLSQVGDPLCDTLAHLLYPYTKEGMYGRYFEGECSVNLENRLVVLELEELKAKKDLQKMVLLVLMYQISERMYLGNRLQTKSCVIDEAWDLLDGDNATTAKFIETGYRRARRYNANFVTITQSINDYFKNATAIAAYENSDYKLILAQEGTVIDQLKLSKRLPLDDFTEKLFKSLKKTEDYSECIIKSPSGLSVHRILLDPYSRILYSSKGDEFEAVKALEAQGLSLHEAIAQVARKFNYVQ